MQKSKADKSEKPAPIQKTNKRVKEVLVSHPYRCGKPSISKAEKVGEKPKEKADNEEEKSDDEEEESDNKEDKSENEGDKSDNEVT
ncbi:hypothetical protein LINPERHAP2_LOCUS10803 [Linum perenne]